MKKMVLCAGTFGVDIITGKDMYMRDRGFPMVAISEGAKGFIFSYKSRTFHFPSFTVSCIDATGAGDAFCSGLIYTILNNGCIPQHEEQLIEMVLFASACGACAVTEIGCTRGVSLGKVQDLIGSQGERIKNSLSVFQEIMQK